VIQVFVALLMVVGVFFGTLAMVVDLGFGMTQSGAMQNASDAHPRPEPPAPLALRTDHELVIVRGGVTWGAE